MPERLTIQTFVDGEWCDALLLSVDSIARVAESTCTVHYEHHYLINHLDEMGSVFAPAVSINLPLDWNLSTTRGYPAFIYDIVPAGAARRSLERRFGQDRPTGMDMELFLLSRCTPAPVGHLRIKESVEQLDLGRAQAFQRQEVVERTNDFLEYAYEQGAAIGGATGAQGEAPKLLMTEDRHGELHADAVLSDAESARHWLIKFARNRVSERDKNILRAEYHYYCAVAALGLDTVPVDGLTLEEARKPSLWMPRFDRRIVEGRVERLPMESIYSVCGNTIPGSAMRHEMVLRRLVELWRANGQAEEVAELVHEYVRRDLLNRILGNSDNHGRNMSIMREGRRLRLAPIYDLAPMVLDPEGVTRVTKWETERAGAPDWQGVCAGLADLTDPAALWAQLLETAEMFRALPGLLQDLPEEISAAQSIPLNNLDERLAQWGLR